MKTRQQIIMNYRSLMEEAERLLEASGRVRQLAEGPVEESMALLTQGWTGENSRRFLSHEEMFRARLRKRAAELEKTAGGIREAAEAMYRADMQALEIAAQRKS